jgi:ArsR family transcriptional regulator
LSHIRNIEYTGRVSDALRAFKADIFQALAHPTRIAVVEALRGRELGAGALGQRLGLSQANLSQHLAVLRGSAVLTVRREGRGVFYRLRYPEIKTVCETMRGVLATHLRAERAQAGVLMRRVR